MAIALNNDVISIFHRINMNISKFSETSISFENSHKKLSQKSFVGIIKRKLISVFLFQ